MDTHSQTFIPPPPGHCFVVFTVFCEPTAADFLSFDQRAICRRELGAISETPEQVEKVEAGGGFWRVKLTVKPEDKAFWLGYAAAMQFAHDRPHLVNAVQIPG